MNISKINNNKTINNPQFGINVKIETDYVFGHKDVSKTLKAAKKRIEHKYPNAPWQFILFSLNDFKNKNNKVSVIIKQEPQTLKEKFLSYFNFYNPQKDGFAYCEGLTSNSIANTADDAVHSYNKKNYMI